MRSNSLESKLGEANIRPEFFLDLVIALQYDLDFEDAETNRNIQNFLTRNWDLFTIMEDMQMKLSDFDTVRIIGSGSFGDVTLVKHKVFQKHFALKTMRKVVVSKNLTCFNFWGEHEILTSSNSQWLIQGQYAFQDRGNVYMAMEFMPGCDLEKLAKYRMTKDMVRFYVVELVLAVDALHTMGYIHCDIKLKNFLIGPDGHVKLGGFDRCLKLNSHGEASLEFLLGTPNTLAPEVLTQSYRGKVSDWWSLGVAIYHLIIGKTLFAGDSFSVIHKNVERFLRNPGFSEVKMSMSTEQLLLSFLTTRDRRLGAGGEKEIMQHLYFNYCIWNSDTVQTVRPPLVPDLSIEVNPVYICHLEEDECPVETFPKPKEFEGNHLFFVGYTFSRNVHKLNQAEKSPEPCQEDADLENQNNELQEHKCTLLNEKCLLEDQSYELQQVKSTVEHQNVKKSAVACQNSELQIEKTDLEDQNYKLQEEGECARSFENSELQIEETVQEDENLEMQETFPPENQNSKLQEEDCALAYQKSELQTEKTVQEDQNYELQREEPALQKRANELLERVCAEENENSDLLETESAVEPHISIVQKKSHREDWNFKRQKKKSNLDEQYFKLLEENLQLRQALAQILTHSKAIKEICEKVCVELTNDALTKLCGDAPDVSLVQHHIAKTVGDDKQEVESQHIVEESGVMNCMGHEFVRRTYRSPKKCGGCNRDLWNMFRPPQAVKCTRCHLSFHQHHLDAGDGFPLMCPATNTPSKEHADEPCC